MYLLHNRMRKRNLLPVPKHEPGLEAGGTNEKHIKLLQIWDLKTLFPGMAISVNCTLLNNTEFLPKKLY